MPALRGRRQLTALLGYVCVAIAFSWPIPVRLSTALPGPVSGDTGVYVWNLWVFSHELFNGRFPFFTPEILSLTPPVPLTFHNYTTAANIVAIPLLRVLNTVATFNLIAIASMALAAFGMFLFARRMTNDDAAGWIAGLLFGFSPFISARLGAHMSLVQAAPLPIFALVLHRLGTQPSLRIAVAAGAVVAWAFLSDPYYAVYCVLMAAYSMVYGVVTVHRSAGVPPARVWRASLDVCLICLAGLIAGIVLRGGGRFEVLGITVSINRLYTPVLAFTFLFLLRLWLAVRPRIALALPPLKPQLRLFAAAAAACFVVLSPVLSAMAPHVTQRDWMSPGILWRSSPAGADLLAFFVPSPLHPIWGSLFSRGMQRMPGEIVENTASLSWVAIGVLLLAVARAGTRLPRLWTGFTAFFALLALGPFIHIAGVQTYVPTPWSLLRYVPVLGAARMPTRFSIIVMFGVAVLTAIAIRDLRQRWRRPGVSTAIVAALLLIELTPAPRTVHSARVPSVYNIIAADPRPIRILQLPVGLRDGVTSYGNHNAEYQFFQTVHEKRLIGGYLSRLPKNEIDEVRQFRLMRVLLDMSAGEHIPDERVARASLTARATVEGLNVGYVVINRSRTTEQLRSFALNALGLTHVASDGPIELYQTSLPATETGATEMGALGGR
jgi:hypothetical protein